MPSVSRERLLVHGLYLLLCFLSLDARDFET